MILVVDNYDSFTYNLVHLLERIGAPVEVHRNNRISIDEIDRFEHVLLSPGPGIPSEAAIMPELVRRYSATKRILGVCLGHQCIGEVFGARLHNMEEVVHGKGLLTRIVDPEEPLFKGIPREITTGRYHSWIVDSTDLPESLRVTAVDAAGCIMALRHSEHDVRGVQFHPESVLTEYGEQMLRNWIEGGR
jgi:anthranilate synthase component II